MNRHALVTALFVSLCCKCLADQWPQFRGPAASGLAASAEFPTHWDSTTNVRWSVEMPHPGNGSPIVYDGKVFACSAEDAKGLGRSLICFNADDGARLWARTVTIEKEMPTHKTNPYAGSTPACDGQHVVVWHASAGLHAYTMDGRPLWSRDLGEFRHMWGYGSSPIIIGDRVVLNSGPAKEVFVAGIRCQNWRDALEAQRTSSWRWRDQRRRKVCWHVVNRRSDSPTSRGFNCRCDARANSWLGSGDWRCGVVFHDRERTR